MKRPDPVVSVVVVLCIAIPIALWLYLGRTVVLAEEVCPNPRGGVIRILEIPRHDIIGRVMRDDPRYRFEYVFPDGYVWSSTSFVGESYRAQTARVVWENQELAVCYLDERPMFTLRNRQFEPFHQNP